MMLEQVLKNLHNWFDVSRRFGTFTVKNGDLECDFLKTGQYYRIIGSTFNDGLHRYGEHKETQNEEFNGAVWVLAIPPAVVALAEEIDAWQTKNSDVVSSPFASESFGGYSYTKKSEEGAPISWQSIFRARLNEWRKI